jgi:hypothetical protein
MKAQNIASLVLSTDRFSGNADEFGELAAENISRPDRISTARLTPLSRAYCIT